MRLDDSVIRRFWAKVDKDGPLPEHCPEIGPCWLWTASRRRNGYGQFGFRGRVRCAHIVAYILTYGHEPTTEQPLVLHACDNGQNGCIRPSHLFLGTHASNTLDKVSKARQAMGVMLPQAKMTSADVTEIRRRRAKGERVKHLAAEYGVGHSDISKIVNGQLWRHV
jgi:hypothetical protein